MAYLHGKLASLGLLLASTSTNAFAQAEPQPTGAEEASPEGRLEEIVVTAQRREQRLQDVPISISVIGGEALAATGVKTVAGLAKLSSSININVGNGPVLTFIRGIGNTASAAGNEGSAAIYVDGIYVARAMTSIFSFNSIDRVEVLKGPQGTLFGRNSAAGLINLITRTPSKTPTLEASVGYGNYRTTDEHLYVSTGLGQNSAIDLTAFFLDQDKGWGKNVNTGQDIGRRRDYGVRSKFVTDFSDTTHITLAADYIHSLRDMTLGNPLRGQTAGNPLDVPPAIYRPLSFFDQRASRVGFNREISYSFSARIDQELSFANFVSITGYRRSTAVINYDSDNTPFPASFVNLDNRSRQFSQEIQLQSKKGSTFDWLLGLFYLDAEDGYPPATLSGSDQGAGRSTNLFGNAKVKSYAAFAQATKEILPGLSLTLGARYTIDEPSILGHIEIRTLGPDPLNPLPGSALLVRTPDVMGQKTFRKLTWRGALDYKLSDDVLLFGSISRGYKAGVFETLPANPVAIKPEVVDAYELGLKSELFDRRLRLNGSLFWSDLKDPQVLLQLVGRQQLLNAESARSRGAEIELEYAATERLRLRFGGTYLDATYRSFKSAPFNARNDQLVNGMVPGCSVKATVNLNTANGGNVDYCSGDASGNRLPRAPKFTFNTGFDYRVPVGNGQEVQFGSNLAYNDGFFWEPQNSIAQSSYALVDAYVSYAFNDGKFKIRLWGRNLTDNHYYENAFIRPSRDGTFGQVAPPRTYGASFDIKF